MLWLRASLLSLCIASCGFKPVHNIANIEQNLPSIYIEDIKTSEGYLLKNKLEDKLLTDQKNLLKKYSLKVHLNKSSNPLTIQKNNFVTYYNVTMSGFYELKSLQTDEIIYHSSFHNISSYSATNAEFANYVFEEDAIKNNIEQVSEYILIDLNRYFISNPI
ncbi:MAG: hypothetical protein ACK4OM_00660 [Alphaproteobacteria bacterium]